MSEGSQLAASIVGGVVMVALVLLVYGLFKRPVHVEAPERVSFIPSLGHLARLAALRG